MDIDFVVLWVNGQDKKWQEKRNSYLSHGGDESSKRFRDYGTLKYWFRSVDKYANWVHKIYFVTDGQIPDWLDVQSAKVEIVNHKDIIPKKFLPVFNSNAIEMGIFNIPNLSEHFVAFNDDMYINDFVKPTDFFSKSGKARDIAVQNAIMPVEDFDHISTNNLEIINQEYSKYSVLKTHMFKFFNIRYSYFNILSVLLLPWPRFTRFFDPHVPISFVRSSAVKFLNNHSEVVSSTMSNRFRSTSDYSIWLLRYVQLVNGNFSPRSMSFGKKYNLTDLKPILNDIVHSRHKVLCINDSSMSDYKFEENTKKIRNAFMQALPDKCQFELKE